MTTPLLIQLLLGGLITFLVSVGVLFLQRILKRFDTIDEKLGQLSEKHAVMMDKVNAAGPKLAEHTQDIYHLKRDVRDLKHKQGNNFSNI